MSSVRSPLGMAALGFLVAGTASLLIGVFLIGDPLREAAVPAVWTGVGVAVAYYVYLRFIGPPA